MVMMEHETTAECLDDTVRAVTASRDPQEALRFQAQLLAAVAQSVVAVDTSGRVLYCNSAAARLFGLDPATAVGRPISTLMRASHSAEEAREVLARLRAGRRVVGRHDDRDAPRRGAPLRVFRRGSDGAAGRARRPGATHDARLTTGTD